MTYTSIQITPETRIRLQKLKEYSRETYDEIINKLMQLVPEENEHGKISDHERARQLHHMHENRHKPEHRRELT